MSAGGVADTSNLVFEDLGAFDGINHQKMLENRPDRTMTHTIEQQQWRFLKSVYRID